MSVKRNFFKVQYSREDRFRASAISADGKEYKAVEIPPKAKRVVDIIFRIDKPGFPDRFDRYTLFWGYKIKEKMFNLSTCLENELTRRTHWSVDWSYD